MPLSTPSPLSVFASASTEDLLNRLLYRIIQPLAHPFDREIILVGDVGQAKWLENHLAEKLTICAHVEFFQPKAYIDFLLAGDADDGLSPADFHASLTRWRLFERLSRAPLPETLSRYLENDETGQRRFELADQISHLFERYQLYRPDWLAAWLAHRDPIEPASPDSEWQALLWRELVAAITEPHEKPWDPHYFHRRFFERLSKAAFQPDLPARITLFGLSALTANQMAFLCELGKHVSIECLLWDPTLAAPHEADLSLLSSSDHPLVSRWGHGMRTLIQQWRHRDGDTVMVQDHLTDLSVKPNTLLGRLQQDILANAAPERSKKLASRPDAQHEISFSIDHETDRSIHYHLCTSLMREMEVLHDQILWMIEEEHIQPREILVLLPDLYAAQPMIEAVFGTAPKSRNIPYSIAERYDGLKLTPFLDVFTLLGSRFELHRLIPLWYIDALAKRFELPTEHLETLIDLLEKSGVRWGIDQGHREKTGFEKASARHSWRHGISRLMLGYAMPERVGKEMPIINGMTVESWLEGQAAQKLLGPLLSMLETFFALAEAQPKTATPIQWLAFLRRVADLFEADGALMIAIGQMLDRLATEWSVLSPDHLLDESVVHVALSRMIQATPPFYRQSDGVVFASIGQYRQIPYRVICVVGVNADTFPRPQTAVDFDLMRQKVHRRPTDPDNRTFDRGAMLDALLAAKERFYLSVTAFSHQTKDKLPLSVIVSEWLDALKSYAPKVPFTVVHPLHPFSPQYDGQEGRITFATEYESMGSRLENEKNWIGSPLPLSDADSITEIDWADLLAFYRHPIRFFCQRRLGLFLPYLPARDRWEEPFVPSTNPDLDRQILSHFHDIDPEELHALITASPHMPSGVLGELFSAQQVQQYQQFAAQLQARMQPFEPIETPFHLSIHGITLRGTFSYHAETGWVGYEMKKLSARHQLHAYLHAVLMSALEQEMPAQASWIGLDAHCQIAIAPEAGGAILEKLVAYYQQGQQEPLPFFLHSSLEYATATQKNQPYTASRWQGGGQFWKESQDPWHQLVFKTLERPDNLPAFKEVAVDIYGPMLASMTKKTF